jgi:hypothetical protein
MADRRDVDSHRDSLAYRSLDVLSRYKMNGLIVDLDEAVDLTLEAARMTKGIYTANSFFAKYFDNFGRELQRNGSDETSYRKVH